MSYQSEKIPTILLWENDDETRRILITTLRDNSYRIIPAFDEINVITMIDLMLTDKAINIDLFLINQVDFSLSEYIAKIQNIYQQTNLSPTTPIIIMADNNLTDLEGTVEQLNENIYVIYLESGEQLIELIERLCFNN